MDDGSAVTGRTERETVAASSRESEAENFGNHGYSYRSRSRTMDTNRGSTAAARDIEPHIATEV